MSLVESVVDLYLGLSDGVPSERYNCALPLVWINQARSGRAHLKARNSNRSTYLFNKRRVATTFPGHESRKK